MPQSWIESRLHQDISSFEEPIKLSIISDSVLMCEALARLLTHHLSCSSITICGAFEIPAVLPQPPCQIVLIDASSDIHKAVRSINSWYTAHPQAAILAIELANSPSDIVACIEAGAKGYTLRGAGTDVVIEALRLLQSGQAVCSLEIAAQVFERLAQKGEYHRLSDVGIALTEREIDVLACLAADYSNQEIAERLVIEVRTVKHHVHNILAKLKARHRWQAVTIARDQGLITK